MQTLTDVATATLEIKKSTFHAFLVPFAHFETWCETLKTDHPKARHIVWAYRVPNAYDQMVENQTDDGEPKGTSGPPALAALRGAELVDVAVLIVRYFGGIKLGPGGLVRAYAGATNAAIDAAILVPYAPKASVRFYVPYALVQRVEYWVEKEGYETKERVFDGAGATWELALTKAQEEAFRGFTCAFVQEGLAWL
ncbi:MAG: YigZ family protein [Campylobacterales bacterium]|nr:YigZ family protein [Campylobacterales bacterium]